MGHRVSCPDFIGRAEQLDLLDATLDVVERGTAATVLVGGEAGIGKTRLVDEFCQRVRGREALVAAGACVPVAGGGLPYGPVVGILRDVTQQLGEASAAAILGPLASGLGFGQPIPGDATDGYSAVPRASDELAKTRLFESILACFTRLAERGVIVLVFEDLQWADSASADLLSFLVRNLTATKVLLIGTYRTEELGRDHQLRPWMRELGRHGRVTNLRLDGLDRDEMAEMIGGILGHQPDWALVDAVWARSEGNAFFAEELTAARHSPTLSAELQGVIMARVEGLSTAAQQLLRLVATAGSTAAHELLVTVDLLDAESLDRALAETIDQQILVVDSSQVGYQFRHALLREAVYASLLPGERGRLHRQIARAITTTASIGPAGPVHTAAELAAHWWAAGEFAEALDTSIEAAGTAIAVWAFPEALTHLERALAALARVSATGEPTAVDRLDLLEKASDVAYLAGEGQRSADLAQAAIDGADVTTSPLTLARYHALMGRNAWAIGDSDAAFRAYRQAATLVPADPPSVELARVLAEEARGLTLMSRFTEAELLCHDALAVADAVGARAEEGHIRCTLGCCRASLGHSAEGIGLVREALAIAEALARPDDLNRAYGNLSSLLVDAGRLDEAVAVVFDSAAVGEELWGIRLNGAAGNSTEALVRLGRYDEAAALLAQMSQPVLGACAPAPYLLPTPMAIRRGDFEEAGRLLASADELTVGLADVQQAGTFHVLSAELALAEGRPDDGYEEAQQALALAAGTDDEIYRPEMCALAARALADGFDEARVHGRDFDLDKARLLASGLVDEVDRLVEASAARGGTPTGRSEAFRAMCAAERSRLHASDADLWDEAARRWRAGGEPYPAAYCLWRAAEARLERRAGQRRADESLQDAWRISVELGADPLRDKIERLAQRARITLAAADHAPPADGSRVASDLGLTPREVEVLGQLADGRTDGEIAELLFISKKTVSVHVSNLLRKLDVANRVEAGKIGQAQRLGTRSR